MNKEKVKNTMLVVLTTGLVSMTIAYASFTSQLLIKDNNIRIGNDSWDIHFENGQPTRVYGLSNVINEPELSYSLITNLDAKFNAPGDYLEYDFDIKNGGTLNAVLGAIVYNTPTCTSGVSDESTAVCNKLSYVVKNRETGNEIKMGDELDSGESIPATLIISYDSSSDVNITDEVTATDFSVLFTYYQR